MGQNLTEACTILRSGVPTKFGGHRAFLKQFDLWLTFDIWWGRFENVLLSLEGPNPTPMPSFSPIPQNTTKRIAGQPYRQTADRQTGRQTPLF